MRFDGRPEYHRVTHLMKCAECGDEDLALVDQLGHMTLRAVARFDEVLVDDATSFARTSDDDPDAELPDLGLASPTTWPPGPSSVVRADVIAPPRCQPTR